MNRRHPNNSNLVLHYGNKWNGLPVQSEHGPLVENYLVRIHETMGYSLRDSASVSAMRFDLRIPWYWPETDTGVITRFIESLRAQIDADERRKSRQGIRVHPARLRYVWVRERDSAIHWHYHVVIFVNRDAYFTLGQFRQHSEDTWIDVPRDAYGDTADNMSERILRAWASALGCSIEQIAGVLHFSDNGVYSIKLNSPDYCKQFADAFYRLSYMAKADTKQYGDSSNNFGCSRA